MKARRSIIAVTSALLAAAALGLPAAARADGGWKKHDRHRYEQRYEHRHHGKHWAPPGHAKHHWKHKHYGRHYGPPAVVYKPYPVYRYAPRPHYGYGYRDGITIIYRGHF